jgi:hypothetical protein
MVLQSKILMLKQENALRPSCRYIRARHDIRESPESAAMNRPKTAILWGQDDLLAEAMEKFLQNEEGWQVIRIPFRAGACSLAEQVQRARPELVIICHRSIGDGSDPLLKLTREQPELNAIAGQPELRVIAVSLANNVMQVYSKHTVTVRSVSDLLSVIEDRYSHPHSTEKEVHEARNNRSGSQR